MVETMFNATSAGFNILIQIALWITVLAATFGVLRAGQKELLKKR